MSLGPCQTDDLPHGTGQVTFSAMMRMFRDELLDLKEILEYIKMQPKEDATTSTVRDTT